MNTELFVENEISRQVIGCALDVHKSLGPGLLEQAYKTCLAFELQDKGLQVEIERPMPLIYRNIKMECGYRADQVVENKVIVEIKSVEALNDVHKAQVLTYLRLSHCRLGLLINFNVALLKEGIKRLVL